MPTAFRSAGPSRRIENTPSPGLPRKPCAHGHLRPLATKDFEKRGLGAGSGGPGGWGKALPLLLIVLVLVLLFADVLLGDRTLYFRDIYNNHLPLKTLQAEQILAGEAPLWNPALSGGQPLLANLNLFTFHPATLLFLMLDPVSAVNWAVFLQLLLAGCSSFLLARRLGWGDGGALFTAFAFTLSGYMLSLGNLLNMLNSAAWLPLTAWLFLGWRRDRSPLAGAGCVLSLAVQLLGGDPGLVLATLLLMALLVFRRREGASPRWSRLRDLVSVVGLSLAAAGLCSLQFLPFLELLQQTVRGWGFTLRGATFWSTHPLRLVELHLPAFFGDVNSTVAGALWGHRLFDDGYPLILSIYAGQAVLLFAALALLRWRRDRDAVLFGLLLVTGLVLSLGGHTPLYRLVYVLPVTGGMRFPSRYLILVVLALALLAGKAFGRLAGSESTGTGGDRSVSRLCLAAMGWSVLVGLVMTVTALRGDWAVSLISRAAARPTGPVLGDALAGLLWRGLVAQLFLFGSAVLALSLTRERLSRAIFTGIGLALLVADLCLFGAGVNFRTDRSFFSSVPPAAEAIRADAGHPGLVRVFREDKPKGFRIDPPAKEKEWICLWDRSLLSPPSGLLLGIGYDLGVTTDLLSPRSTAEATRRMYRGGLEERRLLWNLCAVDYILGFDDPDILGLPLVHRTDDFSTISMQVLRNRDALPRARLVPDHLSVGEGDELDMVFGEGFDPRQQVVLNGDAAGPVPPSSSDAERDAGSGACRIVHDSPARVTVEVDPGRTVWLVLADSWFPGWEAEVDGRSRPILRANGLHRAVWVAPGDREVTFFYRPGSWRAGLLLSLATALALGVFFGLTTLRRRGAKEGR